MTNLERLLTTTGLSHSKLSAGTRKKGNWFNDAYNNNEDIRLSSLAKLLAVIDPNHGLTDHAIAAIYDETVLRIAVYMNFLLDEEEPDLLKTIRSENELITDLLGDWGSLEAKKKLTPPEKELFNAIKQNLLELQGESSSC
jgi:hypothetical protein